MSDMEFYTRADFPHAHPESVGFLNRVMGVLAEMPEDQQLATTHRYIGGWEPDKIAAELGIEEHEVVTLAASGLRRLKEADIL